MFKCSTSVQMFKYWNVQMFKCSNIQMFKCQVSNVKYQMSIVNKVKLLSERTSGVPPIIFFIFWRNWRGSISSKEKNIHGIWQSKLCWEVAIISNAFPHVKEVKRVYIKHTILTLTEKHSIEAQSKVFFLRTYQTGGSESKITVGFTSRNQNCENVLFCLSPQKRVNLQQRGEDSFPCCWALSCKYYAGQREQFFFRKPISSFEKKKNYCDAWQTTKFTV